MFKVGFAALVCLFASLCFGAGGDMGVATQPLTDGSESYPYLIEDFYDFQEFASDSSYWAEGVHIKLTTDIDLDPSLAGRQIYTTAVIAPDTDSNVEFAGTAYNGFFNGNEKVISNMTIVTTQAENGYLGLFGYIGTEGVVEYLDIVDYQIDSDMAFYSGGLCGYNNSEIYNCTVAGGDVIVGEYSYKVGGLCGYSYGESKIHKCRSDDIYVECGDYSDGIACLCGFIEGDVLVFDCQTSGTLVGGDRIISIGLLVGWNYYSTISACFAEGQISSGLRGDIIGGLVGGSYKALIDKSSCDVEVIYNDDAYDSCTGSFAGYNAGGMIRNCYSSGSLIFTGYVGYVSGGFAGVECSGTIRNSYYCGDPEVSYYFSAGGYLVDCFYDSDVFSNASREWDGAVGLTTAQMQSLSTYLEAGWDLNDFSEGDSVWFMEDGIYPMLGHELPSNTVVPDVGGMTAERAQQILNDYELSVERIEYVASLTVPSGIVTGISLNSGDIIDKTVPVVIYVSNGQTGAGTEASPYMLACLEDIKVIDNDLQACYELSSDIYIGGSSCMNVSIAADSNSFEGVLDGNGYCISGLMKRHYNAYGSVNCGGLFDSIGTEGCVKNLVIDGAYVSAIKYVGYGTVCYSNEGLIKNCRVEIKVECRYVSALGGICAENIGGTIKDSVVDFYLQSQIDCDEYSGGICGYNTGTITGCEAKFVVDGGRAGRYVGGGCGENDGGTITNCSAKAEFEFNEDVEGQVGGFCGSNLNGVISFCISDCNILNEYGYYLSNVGGFCGNSVGESVISFCSAKGRIESASANYLGGFCGYNTSVIYNCCSTVDAICPTCVVTGLVGGQSGVVFNCYAAGNVEDGYGLLEENDDLNMSNCFWDIEACGSERVSLGGKVYTLNGEAGKTTDQMKSFSTFKEAGWPIADFTKGIPGWYMPEVGYPKLAHQKPDVICVPDVIEKEISDAQEELTHAGIAIGQVNSVNSWQVPEGCVTGLSACVGGYIDPDVVVDVYVSMGNGGTGTMSNPYRIAGQTDLETIDGYPDSNFSLVCDLYFKCSTFYERSVISTLNKSFNGNGHSIYNLTLGMDDSYQQGLIDTIGTEGLVSDLSIRNAAGGYYAASLFCRINNGQISNCHVDGFAVSLFHDVGSLCLYNYGIITNCDCKSYVIVGLSNSSAGLVVYNYGTIGYSKSSGKFIGISSISGFVGNNYGSIYCSGSAMGITALDYQGAGGFALYNRTGGIIRNCFSTGDVSGESYTGGFITTNYGDIDNCYASGKVEGGQYCGGFAGEDHNGLINNCYASGPVISGDYSGGFVGRAYRNCVIENCFCDVTNSGLESGIGDALSDATDVVGKTSEGMITKATFIDAGWDFVGEDENGTDDVWRMCEDGVYYPKLAWEYSRKGDFACGDGVDEDDLAVLAGNWMNEGSSLADANFDDVVDISDLAILSANWLRSFAYFDIIEDGIIDMYDLGQMSVEWDLSDDDLNADVWPLPNGDGAVDINDFALLAEYWLCGVY